MADFFKKVKENLEKVILCLIFESPGMRRSVQMDVCANILYMFNGSNSAVLAILVVGKSKFSKLGPNQDRVSP